MQSQDNSGSGKRIDRRRFLKASGAGAVALSLAGCTSNNNGGTETSTSTNTPTDTTTAEPTTVKKQSQDIPTGGTFTLGMSSAPKGLNTLSTSSAYSFAILDLVNGYGTTVDPVEYKVRPGVYTDWTVKNANGPDSKPDVYFNVRKGLKFNDGKSMSVEDVLFTYQYMMDKKPGRYVSTVKPIEKVEKASGKWDVHMKLSKPIGTYDSNQLGIPILPKHIWSGVKDFKSYEPSKNGGPVGLGPATVTKYSPDTAIALKMEHNHPLYDLQWRKDNDHFLAGGPFVDEVHFKIYGSDSALQQAFLQGQIDSIYSQINTSNVDKVKQNQGQSLVHGSDTGFNYFAYNLRRTPLDDTTFRQALSFAFDDYYWLNNLQRGYQIEGNFVMPPAYVAVRPESAKSGVKIGDTPAAHAFHFRQSDPGVMDKKTIRKFLTDGTVIDGSAGTYAGKKYPGSLTGVKAGQSSSQHKYTFGSVKSSVLKQQAGIDKEIRVDGKTITEILGRPLQMYIYPAKKTPKSAKMVENWVTNIRNLGIPMERKVMSFNTMLTDVYGKEDFDIYPMAWSSLSPFATSTLYSIFDSDNADDHSKKGDYKKKNTPTLLNNAMGYGLTKGAGADDLISKARIEMDAQKRNSLAQQAVERIYLDFPYMVNGYDKIRWPVNSADFAGFLGNIAGPGGANLATQLTQVHKKQ